MANSQDESKVALVTGGSSGIGEGIVKLLLEKGYKVAFCGSKQEKVDRVLAESSQLSPMKFQPLGLVLDLSDSDNAKLVVEQTIKHFGRLDVLVNNAGIFSKTDGEDSQSYDSYRHLMSINFDASVRATMTAVDELRRNKGHLIFISSTAAVKPHEHAYAYCASKAAMTMFAQCLAIDLAQQVRVNVVSPGPVVTDIFNTVGLSAEIVRRAMGNTTLEGRCGQPKEIAELVLFLLSPSASYISGQQLIIDGGYVLKPSTSSANNQIQAAKKKD